ncbi:hypothetical protein [Wenzhouxiangella marina]|uniref:Uncharacterized protein n=1 Tax=Wenzhouxiangella marina TaxID=1579979 RepID=A0A0K0XV33_9GAMM|nr:hypothetical protein [Wenzhouxiangella marina]AKS41525.1 hypothetical protein WM2015_1151 [Wenzhouxiangella marina]MBB6086716.1 hypothetical protein [Wenzhouxiangella marina]
MTRILATLSLLLLTAPALAYIGPGSGIGLLGSLWVWLVGIVVVLLTILAWPLRWMLRRMRASRQDTPASDD